MTPEHQTLLKLFTDECLEIFEDSSTLFVNREEGLPEDSEHFKDRFYLPPIFENRTSNKTVNWMNLDIGDSEYDLIFGDIPMGVRGPHPNISDPHTNNCSWNIISHLSQKLTTSGVGIFVMEPRGFSISSGRVFLEHLRSRGIFILGYIDLPDGLYKPVTGIRPILVVTGRLSRSTRLGELSSLLTIKQLVSEVVGENHQFKVTDELKDEFKGFDLINVRKQISNLKTRYKDYRSTELQNLTEELIRGSRETLFEDKPNSLYLRCTGSNISPNLVTTEHKEVPIKQINCVQLVLKSDISNEYLKVFFQSHLGQLILRSVMSGMTIQSINVRGLMETDIPFPEVSTQGQIVESSERFSRLEEQINQLRTQISLNPDNLSILSKMDSILEITESLTDGDKIKSLVLKGESKSLEFKQTFDLCLKEKTKQKYVEQSCLKTIVGFLNTDGGVLLIGVEDSGLIPGIDHEREKFHHNSNDKYLLYLKDKIKKRIGTPFFRYIDTTVVEVESRSVVKVDCHPSDEEVFLDEKEFYIRTSPSTDKLEGKELSSYLKKRFN